MEGIKECEYGCDTLYTYIKLFVIVLSRGQWDDEETSWG
jgi:hypothetical protein